MSHFFKIFTFGCKVNQADSAGLRQQLLKKGFWEVELALDADCLIINSCAVTAESVRKARQTLRSLRRRFPKAAIVVTGCWPQAFPEDAFDGADIIVGTKERERIPGLLMAHFWRNPKQVCHAVIPYLPKGGEPFSALPCADTQRTRAFLKIQEGCNQFCSYCIIPYARGRCRSMPVARVAEEANHLAEQGFREIVLTGINLGFYGVDTGESLADAVAACAAPDTIARVRLGSLEPERMDREMLLRLAECEKFCPQFHLSLQSGSTSVLQRMRRRYNPIGYRRIVAGIREVFPEAAITTDVIVGFPGETDVDFEKTVRMVRKIGFAKVHIFPYSPREGTPAAAMPDQISGEVKSQRAAVLAEVAAECTRQHLAGYVGRTVSVLVECKKYIGAQNFYNPKARWTPEMEREKYQNAQSFYQGHMADGTLVKIFAENGEKGLQNSVICVTIEEYADDCCIAHLR